MEKELILKWINGSGYGYGDGYGYGYGDGSGYGYGSGSGDGYGYGDGEKLIKLQGYDVFYIDQMPTIITSIKGNYAKGYIVSDDYQLTPCYVAKDEYTNLFAHGATLKEAVSSLQEKVYKDMSEEDRIKAFTDNFKPNKAYKGTEFFKWHNILTGSCLMGREQFVKDKGIDLNAEYTVLEFIRIVENSYGGGTIKRLKKYYENS